MKNLKNTKSLLNILFSTCLFFVGCDNHEYNKEADKQAQIDLQSGMNPTNILYKSLRDDASPSVINDIIAKGGDPDTTIGKNKAHLIAYAKSPKAMNIIVKASGEINDDTSGRSPLFYYQSRILCEDYIDTVLSNTQLGEFYNTFTEKTIKVTRESVRNSLVNKLDDFKRNPLFYAKNKEMVDYWIENGKNLNNSDRYGKNVLSVQISFDNVDIEHIKYLIEKGADVNFGEEEGDRTPLGQALASQKSQEIIDLLIESGAKLENYKNSSNLFYSVVNAEQVDFLKSKNLSPDIETSNGYLFHFDSQENIDDIGYFMGETKATTKSPLAFAVGNNSNIELIEALLKAGAKVDKSKIIINNKDVSILRFAISILKNKEMSNLLLEYGASKSFDMKKILSDLVHNKDYKTIIALMEKGVTLPSSDFDNLLFHLIYSKDYETIIALTERGATLSGSNLDDIFSNLVSNEDYKTIMVLIKKGIALSDSNFDHIFSSLLINEDYATIMELINTGIDIVNNSNSNKIFKMFFENKDEKMINKMIKDGFDINKKINAKTALYQYLLENNLRIKVKLSYLEKIDLILNLGFDININDSSGKNLFTQIVDKYSNQYNNLKGSDIKYETWEKLIAKTNNFKNIDLFKVISISEGDPKKMDCYLEKSKNVSDSRGKNILWHIYDEFNMDKKPSKEIILSIVKYSKDLDEMVGNSTILGNIIETKNVSIDIVKAVGDKMKNPLQKTNSNKFFESYSPIDLARKMKRNDIVEYLKTKLDKNKFTEDGHLKIKGFYLGMNIDDAIKVWRKYNEKDPLIVDVDKNTKEVLVLEFNRKDIEKMFNLTNDVSIENFVKMFASAYGIGSFKRNSSSTRSPVFPSYINKITYSYESDDGYSIDIIQKTEEFDSAEAQMYFSKAPAWTLFIRKIATKKDRMSHFD